jgi:hypothetical protein
MPALEKGSEREALGLAGGVSTPVYFRGKSAVERVNGRRQKIFKKMKNAS